MTSPCWVSWVTQNCFDTHHGTQGWPQHLEPGTPGWLKAWDYGVGTVGTLGIVVTPKGVCNGIVSHAASAVSVTSFGPQTKYLYYCMVGGWTKSCKRNLILMIFVLTLRSGL